MNLSDKDLHYALWCAEKHTGNSLYTEAMADLDEGILEIEGYERSGWIKFDSDNPETFPPKDINTLVHSKYGNFNVILFSENEKIIKEYWVDFVTHWRPLPNPPVETEVNNETE